jgi:putative nucleotide binding protein
MSGFIKKRFYYEEFAIILSYNIPQKFIKEKRQQLYFPRLKEVYSQAIGKDYYTLLEIVSDPTIVLQKGEMVYIGKGSPKVKRVSARLIYDELSDDAKLFLDEALRRLVKENEKKFVDFFNNAGPLSPRAHALEILPRIGKKTVEKILFERNIKFFESYEDIKKRVGISNLEDIIFERLKIEVTSKEKLNFYLFAKGVQNTIEERTSV